MNLDSGIALAQEFAYAHDRASGANSSNEGVGTAANGRHLRPDFRGGTFFVSLHIGRIRKLARQENVFAGGGEFCAHTNAAKEAAFFTADGNDFRAIAANQVNAFLAHPIGHEDFHRVAQHAAERGKGDAGIAAGGFGDGVAGRNSLFGIGFLQDAERHTILDAAGKAEIFGLGVEDALATFIAKMNGEERGVADQAPQRVELGYGRLDGSAHDGNLSRFAGIRKVAAHSGVSAELADATRLPGELQALRIWAGSLDISAIVAREKTELLGALFVALLLRFPGGAVGRVLKFEMDFIGA